MTRGPPSSVRPRGQVKARGNRTRTRACDYCRNRKTKCEREQTSIPAANPALDPRCNNCKIAHIECTYEQDAKPRGYTLSHTAYLENRERDIEKYLTEFYPYVDLTEQVGPPVEPWRDVSSTTRRKPTDHKTSFSDIALTLSQPHRQPLASGSRVPRSQAPYSSPGNKTVNFSEWREPPLLASDDDSPPSSDDEYCNSRPPRLGTYDEDDNWSIRVPRFHGKSSLFSLVAETRELRITGREMEFELDNAAKLASQDAAALESKLGYQSKLEDPLGGQAVVLDLAFPPDDLLATLMNLFFSRVNTIRPLLHRPTFMKDIKRQRHRVDAGFACVVLAACAVASRFCNDSRVLVEVVKHQHRRDSSLSRPPPGGVGSLVDDLGRTVTVHETHEYAPWSSAGWKYYDLVVSFMRSDAYNIPALEAIKLTEIQTANLLYQYLLGSKNYARGWCMVGVAIRRAQDLGAHSKKRYAERSLEGELWKRALWCLVLSDRDAGLCGRTGFSCAEYFDIKLPLEVDDEHWAVDEHGQAFFLQQPPRKPALISAFNAHIKLSYIYELATSYLHSVDERRRPMEIEPFDVVGKLEKMMTEWLQYFPSHLKSGPAQRNPIWRMQYNILHIKYHLLRTHIYKSFIPDEKSPVPHPKSGASGASRANGVPTNRLCSVVPSPSNARSTCAMSAHAIAACLRDTLSIIDTDASITMQLCDIPSFITGASFAGRFLQSVRDAKGIPNINPGVIDLSPPDPATDPNAAFRVCTDFLALLQDRWESAATNWRTFMPYFRGNHSAARSRSGSDPGSASQYTGSSGQQGVSYTPPQQTPVPPYTAQFNTGPDSAVWQPSTVNYVPGDRWLPPGALAGACSFDTASPGASTSQSSNGPLEHTSPSSSESQDSEDLRDEQGAQWPRPPGDPCFEAPLTSHQDLKCEQAPEQAVHLSLPEWKASQMPPYQLPTDYAPAFPVSVGEDPARRFDAPSHYRPQDSTSTKYYDHQSNGYNAVVPPVQVVVPPEPVFQRQPTLQTFPRDSVDHRHDVYLTQW